MSRNENAFAGAVFEGNFFIGIINSNDNIIAADRNIFCSATIKNNFVTFNDIEDGIIAVIFGVFNFAFFIAEINCVVAFTAIDSSAVFATVNLQFQAEV